MKQPHAHPTLPGSVVVFGFLNIPVSLWLAYPLFRQAVNDTQHWSAGNALMFLSCFTTLNLLWLVAPLILGVVRTPRLLVAGLAFLLASLFQILLLTDVKVFAFFKFHINGLVLNFLTTAGAEDSLSFSQATMAMFVLTCVVILIGEALLVWRIFYRAGSFAILRQRSRALCLALLAVVLIDKLNYAYADLTHKITTLTSARYYPLYQRVTVKRFAVKLLGHKITHDKDITLARTGQTLNYPRAPLAFTPNAPRPNIVVLFADGFRSDMLTPEVTPHLCEFARDNLTFRNHFSGGNGTRFGTFSFFYGLYGNLWHSFLAARQGPVIFDALATLRYQFFVASSTKLTFPEFRQTVFVKIPAAIHDDHTVRESYKRDAVMGGQFRQFLETRDTSRPFFSFIFFNSSHPFYQYPPEFEKFTPVMPHDVNYMRDMTTATAAKLKNRYQNSLYYIDSLFNSVITELRQRGLFDNTILVITGDHGEEFKENGYFSHNSAFDDYQAKTTMVMRFPGRPPQVITNLTSHLDVVPTILTELGCTTPATAYSHGRSLFTGEPRTSSFCSDYDYGAIITLNERLIIPISSSRTSFTELRTASNYQLIEDRERLKPYRAKTLQVAKDLSTFLK